MATRITMPQLGESVTEGTVTRWLKREGEWVKRDEPFVEIMTDKVNAEVPSPVAGVLAKITVPEGTKLAVGEELAIIDEGASAAERPEGQRQLSDTFGAPRAAVQVEGKETIAISDGVSQAGHFSPIVRRLAKEHGIDLLALRGTGLGGRVTKDDVLQFITRGPQPVAAGPAAVSPVVAPPPAEPAVQGVADETVVPSPMRLAIAEHMVRSVQTAPHAWTIVEVDMTALVRWREQVKEQFEKSEGVALTYLPFVVKATVESLRELPIMNGAWVNSQIVLRKRVNIGIAVALDDGLIVPVVRDADRLSVAGLAAAIADLSGRARAGRLTPSDVQGGTFTVNNPGAFGSISSMPIINQGQAAILAMESIVKRPVVVGDAIAIRSMMNLDLSFDHRIVDGLTAGRFLQAIKRRLESYGPEAPLY